MAKSFDELHYEISDILDYIMKPERARTVEEADISGYVQGLTISYCLVQYSLVVLPDLAKFFYTDYCLEDLLGVNEIELSETQIELSSYLESSTKSIILSKNRTIPMNGYHKSLIQSFVRFISFIVGGRDVETEILYKLKSEFTLEREELSNLVSRPKNRL
jgi:hypothetical protein